MTTKSSIGRTIEPRGMFSQFHLGLKRDSPLERCKGCRAKTLSRLNKEGMTACQSGDTDSAVRLLNRGIELASQAGIRMYEAKLRNNLGLVHLLADNRTAAASEFELALGLVEGSLGRDNKLFHRIKDNLIQACRP